MEVIIVNSGPVLVKKPVPTTENGTPIFKGSYNPNSPINLFKKTDTTTGQAKLDYMA